MSARMHFDAERRPARGEYNSLNHPARPRPWVVEFDAKFAVASDLPRPMSDEPVHGVWPAVGGEAVQGAPVIQDGIPQPTNPRRDYKAPRVEHVFAPRHQEFMITDSERTEPAAVSRIEGRFAALDC